LTQPVIDHTKPIIAVLTEVYEKDGEGPSFKNIHTFCEELNEYITKNGGFFYVFTLKNTSKEAFIGYYFDGTHWQQARLPLPDFVYNRIHSRKTEVSERFTAFIELADEFNIKIFNHRFLSKWEVHTWVSQKKHLHAFLPETYLYRETLLLELLETYNTLYIKPLNGSQGRGIYLLHKEQGSFLLTYLGKEGMKQQQFTNVDDLKAALGQKIGPKPHLVQQGIDLLKWEDNNLDFRVLCHRKNTQEWEVTSVVARSSAEGHFASNLALGGKLLRPHMVLSSFFSKEMAATKLALMKELALEGADCVSDQVNGLMVELGVDIGIDVKGNLWLIEINSKPSKNLGERSGKIRPSARAMIDYCFTNIDSESEGEI
jgi:YheC/D like ATP-grasp